MIDLADPAKNLQFAGTLVNPIAAYRPETVHTRPAGQPLDDPGLCLACPRTCPERDADRALCRLALDALPPRQRQALIWHRLEGLTQAENGRRLGVSERMAGRYVAQAIEHCRTIFDSDSHFIYHPVSTTPVEAP